jgi:hypothetical protein
VDKDADGRITEEEVKEVKFPFLFHLVLSIRRLPKKSNGRPAFSDFFFDHE